MHVVGQQIHHSHQHGRKEVPLLQCAQRKSVRSTRFSSTFRIVARSEELRARAGMPVRVSRSLSKLNCHLLGNCRKRPNGRQIILREVRVLPRAASPRHGAQNSVRYLDCRVLELRPEVPEGLLPILPLRKAKTRTSRSREGTHAVFD
jgi:hypothetical protein